jgi:hypothetical protein
MSSAAAKLGLKCKLYLNTGTYGSPTWSAVNCVSDFTLSAKWDAGEASTRESRMKLWLKTMLDLGFQAKLRNSNSGDTSYTTIAAALLTDATVDLLVLNADDTTNGAWGFRAACQVHSGNEDQGLGAVVFDDIEFKPAPNTDGNYSSALVANGAAVFTAF